MSLFHNRNYSESTHSKALKSYPVIPRMSCNVLQLNMQKCIRFCSFFFLLFFFRSHGPMI